MPPVIDETSGLGPEVRKQSETSELPGEGVRVADRELLSAIAMNDEQAFWVLWRRYEHEVYQHCIFALRGNVADAEDLTSEILLKVKHKLPRYALGIACFPAWIRIFCYNACRDMQRSERRRQKAAEHWGYQHSFDGITATSRRERAMVDAIERVEMLPLQLREIILPWAIEGRTSSEIALQFGVTPELVRKRMQSAREWLRDGESKRGDCGAAGPGTAENGSRRRPARGETQRSSAPRSLFTVMVHMPCGVSQLFHEFGFGDLGPSERLVRSLRIRLRERADDVIARRDLAEQLLLLGRWIEATEEWRISLRQQPHFATVLRAGSTLIKLGLIEEAERVFAERGGGAQAEHSEAIQRNGWLAVVHRDFLVAIEEFQRASEMEPKNAVHWHALSYCHRLIGDAESEVGALNRALLLNQTDPIALSSGHDALIHLGRIEEARSCAQRLAEAFPSDTLTICRLMECEQRLGISLRTQAELKRCLRRLGRKYSGSFAVRQLFAASLIACGEFEKAMEILHRFLRQHSHCPRSWTAYRECLATCRGPRVVSAGEGASIESKCNGACRWNLRPGLLQRI